MKSIKKTTSLRQDTKSMKKNLALKKVGYIISTLKSSMDQFSLVCAVCGTVFEGLLKE